MESRSWMIHPQDFSRVDVHPRTKHQPKSICHKPHCCLSKKWSSMVTSIHHRLTRTIWRSPSSMTCAACDVVRRSSHHYVFFLSFFWGFPESCYRDSQLYIYNISVNHIYIYNWGYSYMGHGQYLVKKAPSHQFLKSVLSFFRFWYISKCFFFEDCIVVFQAPAQFPKIKMSRVLLSINLNFGWSS